MERTTTPGWLTALIIIFAIATSLLFGLWIYRHAQLNSLVTERARLDLKKVTLNEREGKLVERLTEASQPGMATPIAPVDLVTVQLREKLKEIDAAERQTRTDIDQKLAENAVLVKAIADIRQKGFQQMVKLMADANERRKEVATLELQLAEFLRDNDTIRRNKEDEITALSRDVERIRRIGRDRAMVLDRRIAELADRVRQITNQYAKSNREMSPDGTILNSQAYYGKVVIDRGHTEKLRVGVRFTVFNRRGNRNVIKGHIEVTEVFADKSVARVVQEIDGNDPIIAGDFIHNPVFDPSKVQTFAVRGTFRQFSIAELERMIVNSGGRIGPDLATGVDYLVVGSEAQEDIDQAVRIGLTILSEEQLLEFIRPAAPAPVKR